MNHSLLKQLNYFLNFTILACMSSCTFLQSPNFTLNAPLNTPPPNIPLYCDTIICRESLDSSGTEGNNDSYYSKVSFDGRYVVFSSDANNLITGDTNSITDVFKKDLKTGITTLISSDSSGVIGNGYSDSGAISSDSRYVAFYSESSNSVAGDSNGTGDIFMKDTQTGITTLISSDSSGVIGNGESTNPSVSSDGRYVVFISFATNLVVGDSNGVRDVFMKDTQTGITTLISSNSSGIIGNGESSGLAAISLNGRYVVFQSVATNLIAGDSNGTSDVFMKDTQTGITTLISSNSSGVIGNGDSGGQSISSDGRYVVFTSSSSNLVAGDSNGTSDVFMKDTQTGITTLISSNSSGVIGNSNSDLTSNSAISSTGRYVVFESNATNLIASDPNGTMDIFVKDTQTGITTLVSSDSSGVIGNGDSADASISADGMYVVFQSAATNLVPGDTNGFVDVFYKRMIP